MSNSKIEKKMGRNRGISANHSFIAASISFLLTVSLLAVLVGGRIVSNEPGKTDIFEKNSPTRIVVSLLLGISGCSTIIFANRLSKS